MGIEKPYTLHITRREIWSDKKNYNTISMAEWKSYVEWDPQMELLNGLEFNIPGEEFIIKDHGLSNWKVHINNGEINFLTLFGYENGNINVPNPDQETKIKMVAIADRLNAKVQGDNGEIYNAEYLSIEQRIKPWWKFW